MKTITRSRCHETTKTRKRKPLVRAFVFLWFTCLTLASVVQGDGAGLNPADLLKPLADSWSSYSGDYTGRRYSALTQINQSNVKQLTLAFAARLTGGPGGGGGFGPGGAAATIVGGEG